MNTTPKPAQVIAEGRPVLKAHPTISLDAAGLLHALDELSQDDRLKACAYLLHVYGLTVGITDPATRALPEWTDAMSDVAEAAWLARLDGDERPLERCVCGAPDAVCITPGEVLVHSVDVACYIAEAKP